MGLDTSHGCWHGPYVSFDEFRKEIARLAGMPPLGLMEGFWQEDEGQMYIKDWPALWKASLPIPWESLKPDPLHILLNHSDCEGKIRWEDALPIANRLDAICRKVKEPTYFKHGTSCLKDKIRQFSKGLKLAAERKEDIDFD